MKFKKSVIAAAVILTVFMAGAVSASQNMTENIISSDSENNTQSIYSSEIENHTLNKDSQGDVLNSPKASDYKVSVNKTTLHSWQSEAVIIYITPSSDTYKYDFYLDIYNSSNKVIFTSQELYSTTPHTYITYTFPANYLTAGSYTMKIRNHADNKTMSSAKLTVTSEPYYAEVTAGDYKTTYNSKTPYSFKIIEKGSGLNLRGAKVKITFSNGKTYTYTSDLNGVIAFTPSLNAGSYTFTISSGDVHLNLKTVKKTASVKKSSVKIKITKIVEYQGFKTVLKAKVTCNGKSISEGKVLFKIAGKSFKVSVKNGVATKKINLKKIKKYTYTARFMGNSNLIKSGQVKSTVTLKKRQSVTISFKKPVVYMSQIKKITVKIKSGGKYVKGGKLLVKSQTGVDTVKNKNGKVTLYLYGMLSDHYRGSNGITEVYKKTVMKKAWVKYVPSSHKYKSLKKNYKATSKFKCPQCGKTGSHNHYRYGYLRVYTYKIKVI